jgi:8-oxo-dGTP pyrophosphatase MutT (NUDIX family)
MSNLRTSVYGVYFNALNKVLLVKDANSLLWGFPGGGLDVGETHEDALQREFMEETGMALRCTPLYIARHDDKERQRYFYKIARVEGHMNEQGNNDDILGVAYFSVADLPLDLASGVEKIVTKA